MRTVLRATMAEESRTNCARKYPKNSEGLDSDHRRLSKLVAVFLVWVAVVAQGYAAPYFEISNWRREEGLPHNSVLCIAQTQDGYLWCGTDKGLVRFDGVMMRTYDQDTHPTLPSNRVEAVSVGRSGRLWLIAGERLLWFQRGVFHHVADMPRVSSVTVGGMGEYRDGSLLVLLPSGGLLRVDVTGSVSEESLPAGFDPTGQSVLFADGGGGVWIGNGKRLWQLRDNGLTNVKKFEEAITGIHAGGGERLNCVLDDGQLVSLVGSRVVSRRFAGGLRAVPRFVDRQGNFWMNDDRLWVERKGQADQVKLPKAPATVRVLSLACGLEGNVWIGTEGHGLYRLRQRATMTIADPDGESHVASLMDNRDGGIWATTEAGDYVGVFDDHWVRFEVGIDVKHRSLLHARTGVRYLGMAGAGLWRSDRSDRHVSIPDCEIQNVSALFEDRRGRIWIGSKSAGVGMLTEDGFERLDSDSGIDESSVTGFAQDSEGDIWIGTTRGLFGVTEDSLQTRQLDESDGYAGGGVRTLYRGEGDMLWIGTDERGLVRRAHGQFARLDSAHGLFENSVSQILADRQGFLWLGGDRGLSRYPLEELHQVLDGQTGAVSGRRLQKHDGIRNVQCSTGTFPNCLRTGDGMLCFATLGGVVKVDPDAIHMHEHPPPLHITGLSIDGETIGLEVFGDGFATDENEALGKTIRIPAGTRRVKINYAGISHRDPEALRYLTRLVGFDEEWNDAGARREVTFTGLQPDSYRFEVLAIGAGGLTNPVPATLGLIFEPQFHETRLFKGGVVGGFLLAVFAFYRVKQQRIRHVEEIRQRIARDLHDEVGANIGAITLLSGIAAEDQEQGSEGAQTVSEIREVAQKTAHVLREVVWFVNPEFDTMGDLVSHMETLARRMLVDQQVEFVSEVQMPQFNLELDFRRSVFALFKESIHNIVKHAEASRVSITLNADRNRLLVRVVDDGRGFDPNLGGEGNGLKNMRARAAELGGELRIESRPGSGATLSLDVPVR